MKDEFEDLLDYDELNVAEMTGYNAGAWLAESPRTVKGRGYLWPRKEMLGLLSRLAQQLRIS